MNFYSCEDHSDHVLLATWPKPKASEIEAIHNFEIVYMLLIVMNWQFFSLLFDKLSFVHLNNISFGFLMSWVSRPFFGIFLFWAYNFGRHYCRSTTSLTWRYGIRGTVALCCVFHNHKCQERCFSGQDERLFCIRNRFSVTSYGQVRTWKPSVVRNWRTSNRPWKSEN